MGEETNATPTSDTTQVSKRGYTPPKGRRTRPRNDTGQRRRAFGPVAQWITFAIALLVIIVIVIMVTGGGDFNPLNDDDSVGVPATTDATSPS
jgi:hypothetical protein